MTLAHSERPWFSNYFLYMLSGLLLILFALPYVRERVHNALIFDLLTALILCVGVYALSQRRLAFWVGIALGLPTLSASIVATLLPGHDLALGFNYASNTVFFTYITASMVFAMMRERQVSANTLYAGMCCYLLLAFSWANYYACAFLIDDKVFTASQPEMLRTFSDFMYFSVVTLSTVGYGDITPVDPAVRMAAGFEAMVGQLYLTILVARLVGLHLTQHGDLSRH